MIVALAEPAVGAVTQVEGDAPGVLACDGRAVGASRSHDQRGAEVDHRDRRCPERVVAHVVLLAWSSGEASGGHRSRRGGSGHQQRRHHHGAHRLVDPRDQAPTLLLRKCRAPPSIQVGLADGRAPRAGAHPGAGRGGPGRRTSRRRPGRRRGRRARHEGVAPRLLPHRRVGAAQGRRAPAVLQAAGRPEHDLLRARSAAGDLGGLVRRRPGGRQAGGAGRRRRS